MKSLSRCFNCKEKPIFTEIDDAAYPIKLVHDDPTCPYGVEIYDASEKEASASWDMVQSLQGGRGF